MLHRKTYLMLLFLAGVDECGRSVDVAGERRGQTTEGGDTTEDSTVRGRREGIVTPCTLHHATRLAQIL